MGKFKDKTGHNRWQEARSDVKDFIVKHKGEAGPILQGIVKVAVPRAGHVLDAIQEVKEMRATNAQKDKALTALHSLVEDLDDDDAPEVVADQSADLSKLVNSTWVSKYLSPFVLVIVTIIFGGMWLTEIAGYWNLCPGKVDPVDKVSITALFGSLFGLRQIVRGEMKKKLLNQ